MAFRGVEANIELAKYGLVGTRNLAAVPVTALLQARNISLDTGALTRAGGSIPYNDTTPAGSSYLVQEDGSKILQEDGFGILLEDAGVVLPGSVIALKD